MRIQLNARRDDGATAVIVAILTVVLVGMAALALDVGQAYAVKRQLSVSADAAALAGAAEAQRSIPARAGCPSGSDAVAMSNAARGAAEQELTRNRAPATATTTVTTTCTAADGVSVTVNVAQPVPSIFGGVFGVSRTNPSRTATARAFPASAASGLRPFAVCDTIAEAARTTGAIAHMNVDRRTGVCGTNGNGNWGIADFNDGSSPQGQVEAWTREGYPGSVTIPDPAMDAQPGNRVANLGAQDAFIDMVGKTVLLPVVTQYNSRANGTCGGTGCSFNAVAFMAAEICSVWVPSGGSGNYDSWTGSSCHDGAAALAWRTNPANAGAAFIQFRFVDRITTSYVGTGANCQFGASCDNGVRTLQLFR